MSITDLSIGTVLGIILGASATGLINHLLTKSRNKEQYIFDIGRIFLEEIESVLYDLKVKGTLMFPDRRNFIQNKLGSVNFVAFRKTCSRKQRVGLDAAYKCYKDPNGNKYASLLSLKELIEKIINER